MYNIIKKNITFQIIFKTIFIHNKFLKKCTITKIKVLIDVIILKTFIILIVRRVMLEGRRLGLKSVFQ